MPTDRAFQNRLNRVLSDLELMVTDAKKENPTKEHYCRFIIALGKYAKDRISKLEDFGAPVQGELKEFFTNTSSERSSGAAKTKDKKDKKQDVPKSLPQRNSTVSEQQLIQRIRDLERKNEDLVKRYTAMEQHLKHYQKLAAENDEIIHRTRTSEDAAKRNIMEKMEKLKKEKDKALNRLSQFAGSRLKDGNPSIADLSDSNRPTSLSMQLSELYSNEWTNAFEVMADNGMEEKAIINCLLNCIATAFTECRRITEGDTRGGESKSEKLSRLRNQSPDQLKTVLKRCANTVLMSDASLTKAGLQTDGDILKYVDECVNVCWWMCVQDPPLDLLWDLKKGMPVDTNAFTFYTKSGKYVDYIVWPVLYLHKHGPILGKGVLQGSN